MDRPWKLMGDEKFSRVMQQKETRGDPIWTGPEI